jgi:NAD(P)-dependent dehydrogenase (short-subunit alcohol dehydrogenase family)
MSVLERFGLQGRRALVTGASSGLGRHFALSLAQAGASVIVAARSVDKLAETVAEIEAAGGKAFAVRLDVTDPASVKSGFDQMEAAGGAMDVIVNNAGMAVSRPLLEQTEADWDTVLDTNLKGAWLVAQEAARRLVAARLPGSIINIASITGERVAGGVAPYCTSKAGVMHLTRAMALELARHGIRVNALAPGYVQTELNRDFLTSDAGERLKSRIPQRRFGLPEELDGPLLLLASDAGAYITGSILFADGGHLVSSL